MSQPARRALGAALLTFALSACGAGQNASTIPASIRAFQRVQPADTAAQSNSAGVTVFTLGDGGSNSTEMNDLRFGADGKLYYTTVPLLTGAPWPTSGEIGNFDIGTHRQQYQVVSYGPGLLDETADGSVWVTEFNNASGTPTIDRYAGIGGSDTTIQFPQGPNWINGFGNGVDGGIAVTPDNHVWFGSNNSAQVGEIDPKTNAVSLYNLYGSDIVYQPVPQYMTLASDGHLWVTDEFNDGLFRVAVSGGAKGTSTYVQLPQGPYGSGNPINLQGLIQGPDLNIYTGDPAPDYGYLDAGAADANPTFSSLSLPSTGIEPYVFAKFGDKIYFNEIHFEGLGIYNVKTKHVVVLPLLPAAFGGIAVDAWGNPWIGCIPTSQTGCLERVTLSRTWQVYPSRSINLYTTDFYGETLPPGLIGIGENGESGPFTVTTSNAAVCTAGVLAGYGHNIQVNPVKPGSCSLAISDAHGRTINVAVHVINGKGSPQAHVDLRGFRPVPPKLR